jgi:hypothetical protein
LLRLNVIGNGRSRKAPNFDPRAVPEVRKDTTISQVEIFTVGVDIGIGEAASTIIVTAGCADIVNKVGSDDGTADGVIYPAVG